MKRTFFLALLLSDVYCLAKDVPTTSTEVFLKSPIENATLYVPTASIDAYNALEPWKNFGRIVAIDETIHLPLDCDVNFDGVIDVADIACIIIILAAGDKVIEQVITADVNQDGTVDVADIATVISKMVGK